MGGAAVLRVLVRGSWLLTGLSTLLLVASFYLSVARRPTRGACGTFIVMGALLVAVSVWPGQPGLSGWIVIASAAALSLASAYLMMRPRAQSLIQSKEPS